jgi:hypothetical protein
MFLFIYRDAVRVKTSFLYSRGLEKETRRGGAFCLYRDSNAFALAGPGEKFDMLKKEQFGVI